MDKLQIPKLRGKGNWAIWKLQITSNLEYHDFEGVLTEAIVEPAALADDATVQQKKKHEKKLKRYKKANGCAVTLLTTTVEEEPLQSILMLKSAREMWKKLSLSYEQKSEQRLEHLYLQLLEYKKETNYTIAMHISKLQKLFLELREESLRIDKCELPITLLIMRILSTLPYDYFEFRTTWESVPRDQRSVEYLLERLTMVETRLAQRQEASSSSSTSALVAEWHKSGPSTSGTNKKSDDVQTQPVKKKDYSKVRCYSCGNFGHTQQVSL
jgi:hypothetical protein